MEVTVTETEFKIANLIYEHAYYDYELAQILHCSTRTIETHVASVVSKTGCRDKLHLVVWMRNNKLLVRARKITPADIEEMRRMKAEGAKTSAIASAMGISCEYVRKLTRAS